MPFRQKGQGDSLLFFAQNATETSSATNPFPPYPLSGILVPPRIRKNEIPAIPSPLRPPILKKYKFLYHELIALQADFPLVRPGKR